jgi:hypothetical protein
MYKKYFPHIIGVAMIKVGFRIALMAIRDNSYHSEDTIISPRLSHPISGEEVSP